MQSGAAAPDEQKLPELLPIFPEGTRSLSIVDLEFQDSPQGLRVYKNYPDGLRAVPYFSSIKNSHLIKLSNSEFLAFADVDFYHFTVVKEANGLTTYSYSFSFAYPAAYTIPKRCIEGVFPEWGTAIINKNGTLHLFDLHTRQSLSLQQEQPLLSAAQSARGERITVRVEADGTFNWTCFNARTDVIYREARCPSLLKDYAASKPTTPIIMEVATGFPLDIANLCDDYNKTSFYKFYEENHQKRKSFLLQTVLCYFEERKYAWFNLAGYNNRLEDFVACLVARSKNQPLSAPLADFSPNNYLFFNGSCTYQNYRNRFMEITPQQAQHFINQYSLYQEKDTATGDIAATLREVLANKPKPGRRPS